MMNEQQFNPGEIILNKYEISNLIGTGAFGGVYKARDTKLDRTVAIKFLRSSHNTLESFSAEIEAVKRLEHPNIARLYDFDIIRGGTPCLVMEYVNGQELGDILSANGPLMYDRIIEIGLQILDALVETHKRGIIHCDLKPENIMLTSAGAKTDVVKLIDFGVSSLITQMHQSSAKDQALVGTPQYMAPEQIRRENIGPWTDIYAVGLILLELYCGSIIFDDEDPREVLKKQLFTPVPVPPEIMATPIGPVIERAVQKDYTLRYQNTLDFYIDLKQATDTMKISGQWKKNKHAAVSTPVNRERAFPSIFEEVNGLDSLMVSLDGRRPQSLSSNVPVFGRSKLDSGEVFTPTLFARNDTSIMALTPLEAVPQLQSPKGDAVGISIKVPTYARENLKSTPSSNNLPLISGSNRPSSKDAASPNVPSLTAVPSLTSENKSSENEQAPIDFGSLSSSLEKIEKFSSFAQKDLKSSDTHSSASSVDMLSSHVEHKNDSASNSFSAVKSDSIRMDVSRISSTSNQSVSRSTETNPAAHRSPVSSEPEQTKRSRGGIIAIILIVFIGLAGFATAYYFELFDFGNNAPTAPVVKDDKPAQQPVVRRATILAVGRQMAEVAHSSAIRNALVDPKTITHYDVIGTPVTANIYVNSSLVCYTTPCAVYTYGSPKSIEIEIRESSPDKAAAKSNKLQLSEHADPKKPIMLSVH